MWSPPLRWAPHRIMDLFHHKYFHLYNRSNNSEIVFKERENYLFFLKKYRKYLSEYVSTISFCLMPTHFHFLIYVSSKETELIKKNIGILLSSYTKAINKSFSRTGSLFQNHTKTKLITGERYLLTLTNYIHQNPLTIGLVKNIADWEFSSYRDYIGKRKGILIDKTLMRKRFNSIDEFILFSSQKIDKLDFLYQNDNGNVESTSKVGST